MIVDGPSPRRQTGLPPVVPAVVCAGGTRALSPDGGLTVNVPAARSTSPPLATKPLAHVLLMLAWSVTPVASPLGNTTATADVLPATHAGVPETSVSTWPLAPAPSRVAAPARPPTMMSPGWLIGLLKPDVALAQTGSPPTVVSTWLGPPMPSRTGVPPGLLVIRSPVVVIGLVKPAALFCHEGSPALTVSTCPAVPIASRTGVPPGLLAIRSPVVVIGLAKPGAVLPCDRAVCLHGEHLRGRADRYALEYGIRQPRRPRWRCLQQEERRVMRVTLYARGHDLAADDARGSLGHAGRLSGCSSTGQRSRSTVLSTALRR